MTATGITTKNTTVNRTIEDPVPKIRDGVFYIFTARGTTKPYTMKKLLIIPACLIIVACKSTHFEYPRTAKVDTADVYFGKTIADPYRWLEDPTLPETEEWINAQNKVTFGYLNRIPFRDSLKARLTEVWNYERYSTPLKKGEKYYFQKNSGLQNQSVLYVMDSLGAEPRIILDPNLFSQDGTVALSDFALSKDGRYLAYALSKGGSDWNEIFVKDIISGEDRADHLEWIKFSSISWYKKGFYYSRYPKPAEDQQLTSRNLNHQVYYHTLGKPQEKDILVFEDREHPDRSFYADVTTDERFLIVYESESTYGNRVYIKSLEGTGKNFTRLNENFDYEMYIVGSRENDLYLLTNEDAPRNKLVRLTFDFVSNKFQPVPLIPEEDNVLEQVELAGDRIMAKYLVDAHSVIRVMDRQGKFQHDLKLPEYVNVSTMNGETGDNELFYSLASYTIPATIYRYDVKSDSSTVLFKPAVDFNPDDYVTRLEFCTSKDGTKIPLYIVHHKNVKMNGKNPTWLYGYGGFNISLLPRFSPARIVWLENGGIFVNANLGGVGNMGKNGIKPASN